MSRHSFVATDEQRARVRDLAECGAPHEFIASKLQIAKATLEKHFAQELVDGANEAKHLVSEFILNTIFLGRENGLRDDRSRATLAIFYAKTQMRWRETSIHMHGDAPPEDPDAALEALTRGFDRLAARKGKDAAQDRTARALRKLTLLGPVTPAQLGKNSRHFNGLPYHCGSPQVKIVRQLIRALCSSASQPGGPPRAPRSVG